MTSSGFLINSLRHTMAAPKSWFRKLSPKRPKRRDAEKADQIPNDSRSTISPPPVSPTSSLGPNNHGLSRAGNTALNATIRVLEVLSAASSTIPVPGINLPFLALLVVVRQIKTTRQNSQSFRDLADHLTDLQSTITTLQNFSEASLSSIPSLRALESDLQNLQSNIQNALSSGAIERFLDGSNKASSLTAHNESLHRSIGRLTLEVAAQTHQTLEFVHSEINDMQQGMTGIQAGIARVERLHGELSSNKTTPRQGIFFHKVKINTTRSDGTPGGGVANRNMGFPTMSFDDVDLVTGGGSVGQDNYSDTVL